MEKKNTILLTVIAIATLLVAVVGATFAYFTAQVQTTNNDQNTTNVKTAALASASMDMGSKVTADEIYPGAKVVKSVHVTGKCENGVTDCNSVGAVITVTPTIDADIFGTDVEWGLYKSADPITCRNVIQTSTGTPSTEGTTTTTTNQYQMVSTCKKGALVVTPGIEGNPDTDNWDSLTEITETDLGDALVSGTTTAGNKTIQVAGNTDDWYYLVVNYKDNGNQNAQQGKDFSIAIDFSAESLNS